ncbi:MAG: hypothetical protein C0183_10250 [Roseiflexus castenholzii]|uniref:hypothetical protein n=1 Tax=Roseiflexus castenholzii TaxID=120962 RepID=UPI000CB4DA47|nr:MAG: hypothetical protein C0183_10250 [Roseiflexus castenholzii]
MRCLVIVLALMTMFLSPWLPEVRACPDTIEPSPAVTAMPASTTLPVRAVSLDLSDLALPQDRLDRLEQRMRDAGVNMVGLSAGRLDWSGFRWSGKEERWSAGVRESGRDLLANATQRFGRWAHVSAIVDVFAPRYLQTRPTQRALDAAGHPIPYQASTHALVNGSFGDELIAMIDYIARHYEVDSITLTELFYYQEGYGADDLALYREHSGRRDWPRTPRGSINIDHPTIGAWRSAILARFAERAAHVAHTHGKQLFVDVRVHADAPQHEGRRSGHDYALLLQHADRLVLWNYFGLNGTSPEYTRDIAQYVQRYSADRIIISYGLWADRNAVVSATDLQRAMIAGQEGDLPHAWITPIKLMKDEHWQTLTSVWRSAAQRPPAATPPRQSPDR